MEKWRKMGRRVWNLVMVIVLAALASSAGIARAADIRLAENVKDRCVIVAPDEIMKWEGDEKRIRRGRRCPTPEYIAENRRRIRRDSKSYRGRTITNRVLAMRYDKTWVVYGVRRVFHPMKNGANGTQVAGRRQVACC